MKKAKILTILIVILMIPRVVYAEPVDSLTGELEQLQASTVNLISNLEVENRHKIIEAETRINEIDHKMSALVIKIEDNKKSIVDFELKIEEKTIEVEEKEKELKRNEILMDSRVRGMYINNTSKSALSIILNSESIADFITRFDTIRSVMKFDSELIAEIDEQRKSLKVDYEILQSDKLELEELNVSLIEESDKLANNKDEMVNILNSLNVFVQSTANDEDTKRYELEIAEKYKSYVFNDIGVSSGVVGNKALDLTGAKFTRDDIVMYGAQFLGLPYVWGGTTPSGFDCSGYVGYIYNHFGVKLPRVSEDQQHVGTPILYPSQLMAGDLLFYGSPSTHVTMYISPGYMMEAPRTGDVIKVTKIRPYTYARRVINIPSDVDSSLLVSKVAE